jgi:hypothetical protein
VSVILVQLDQPARRAVLVRSIGSRGCDGADAAQSSAVLEEVAIAVRSALLSLLEGGEIGVHPPAATVAARPAPPVSRPLEVRLRAGWSLALSGVAPAIDHGVEAAAALEPRGLLAELRLSSTFPRDVTDQLATVQTSRVSMSVGFGGRLRLSDRLSAAALLHVGVAMLSRTTVARIPEVVAAPPSRTLSPLVAPELRLRARLAWGLAAAIGVGLDYLPRLPRQLYARGDARQSRPSPWVAQPRLVLALELPL